MKNKERFQTALTLILYGLFIYYSSTLIMNAKDMSVKLLYSFVTILFTLIGISSEYLKYLYRKALVKLNMECDPDSAIEIFDKLQKFDYFKAYKKTRTVFDIQVALATLNAAQCIKIIEDEDIYLRSSLELLVIRAYSMLRANSILDNHNQVKHWYNEYMKCQSGKKKVYLYSTEEVDGLYHFTTNDRKKACTSFAKVNTKNMNPKEIAMFSYNYACASMSIDSNVSKQYFNQVVQLGNKLPIVELSKEHL